MMDRQRTLCRDFSRFALAMAAGVILLGTLGALTQGPRVHWVCVPAAEKGTGR